MKGGGKGKERRMREEDEGRGERERDEGRGERG